LLAALVAALAAALLGSTLLGIAEARFAGPVRDFWSVVPLLEAAERGELGWRLLTQPHGGHRLLLPRLLFLAEYRLFGGANAMLVGASVTLQVALALLLGRALWRERSGRAEGVFAVGLVVALAFSASQIENFVRPWNLQYTLACGSAVSALAAGARVGTGRAPWLALCLAGALLASASMATGLLVWPALLAVAAASRFSRAAWLTLGAAAAGVLAAYLQGLPLRPVREALAGGGALAEWTLSCLGSPLAWQHPGAGRALALAGLLAAAALGARVLARGRASSPGERLLLGLLLFSAGAVLLTGMGRAARFPDSWRAARYQTPVLLFWLGLISLALLALRGAERPRPALRAALMAGSAAWLAGAVLPAHAEQLAESRRFAARVRAANLAIQFGVTSREAYEHVLRHRDLRSGTDSVAQMRRFLEERGLGAFADPRLALLGRPFDESFPGATRAACGGGLVSVSAVALQGGHGRRLAGRIAGPRGEPAPRFVVVSDAAGSIVGFGESLASRLGPAGVFRSSEAARFLAYARGGAGLEVWGVLASGRVCLLPAARSRSEAQAPR
jgi:hypothetical protein